MLYRWASKDPWVLWSCMQNSVCISISNMHFPPCEAGSWLPLNFWRSGWLNKSLRVIALKDLCEKVKWKWEKLHVDIGRAHTYLCGWKFLCPSTNASIESSSPKWAVQSYSMARAQGWLGIGRTGRPQEQKEEHFPHWGLVTSQLVKSSGGSCYIHA